MNHTNLICKSQQLLEEPNLNGKMVHIRKTRERRNKGKPNF